jgi:hypothetical protein
MMHLERARNCQARGSHAHSGGDDETDGHFVPDSDEFKSVRCSCSGRSGSSGTQGGAACKTVAE